MTRLTFIYIALVVAFMFIVAGYCLKPWSPGGFAIAAWFGAVGLLCLFVEGRKP